MICHYCGYEEPLPQVCPSCGSRYLGGFKAGTQKIESLVAQRFPNARVMRMDFDTTRTKDSYEKILQSFANHEADILIGTQMIVKGHDFGGVTLVGVLAADMSLHGSDYHAAERTFQLLTQAVGRAGRGEKPGQAVIQTYDPDHYAIRTAQAQDYEAFYQQEIAYRTMMSYPPVWNLLVVHCAGGDLACVEQAAQKLTERLKTAIGAQNTRVLLVGPADASIARINDVYRKVVYMKAAEYQTLVALKDVLEPFVQADRLFSNVTIQYDFNPASGF
jgi:primosomal protein N' (replication factor Y)